MKNLIYIIGLLFLVVACYDDKGNYDYSKINEIRVELPESYGLRLADTTLVIRPVISQNLREKYEHLRFMWQCSKSNYASIPNGDTLGYGDTVAIKIDPDADRVDYNYYLRLNIYDEESGILHPYQTRVQITKPYQGAWMVLHKQAGETRLGAVEHVGEQVQVLPDVYYPATGKKLRGEPQLLVCHNMIQTSYLWDIEPVGSAFGHNILMIVTDDPKESGVYNYLNNFEKWDSLSRLVAPAYRNLINYQNISLLQGEQGYTVCLSDGVFYQGNNGLKLYKAPVADDVTGDMYLSRGAACAFTPIFYDKTGRRFLWFYGTGSGRDASIYPDRFDESLENSQKLQLIPSRPDNVQYGVVDPNNVPEDREVLYIGTGYRYNVSSASGIYCYAFAKGTGDKSYVYEFSSYGVWSGRERAFTGFYEIDTPSGIDENTCFASSIAYNGILFYASGNKVYRLDFSQSKGSPTLIYQHEGGDVSTMKFAKTEVPSGEYPEYIHDANRQLGVVFKNVNGTSDFIVLDLTVAGKPENIHEYKGQFGEIKDVVFL